MATWRNLLMDEIREKEGCHASYECTLSEYELDEEFDDGYGSPQGRPFTAWTAQRVYFPLMYDGSEWVGSAPRFVCDEATPHLGSG